MKQLCYWSHSTVDDLNFQLRADGTGCIDKDKEWARPDPDLPQIVQGGHLRIMCDEHWWYEHPGVSVVSRPTYCHNSRSFLDTWSGSTSFFVLFYSALIWLECFADALNNFARCYVLGISLCTLPQLRACCCKLALACVGDVVPRPLQWTKSVQFRFSFT